MRAFFRCIVAGAAILLFVPVLLGVQWHTNQNVHKKNIRVSSSPMVSPALSSALPYHSFVGAFSDPTLFSKNARVCNGSLCSLYPDAVECAASEGYEYTYDLCPKPAAAAVLEEGVLTLMCPNDSSPIFADEVRGPFRWKQYRGQHRTSSHMALARCHRECSDEGPRHFSVVGKFPEVCMQDDVLAVQMAKDEEVDRRLEERGAADAEAALPLNVIMLFIDSAARPAVESQFTKTFAFLESLEEQPEGKRFSTFTFPFYNTIGPRTKHWFYATMGRNWTAHGNQDPVPASKEGIPWVWRLLQKHGYVTALTTDLCWVTECEDFAGSYPKGVGTVRPWGINYDFYRELGDYVLLNTFCEKTDSEYYKLTNMQYHINISQHPVCFGGDYASSQYLQWALKYHEAYKKHPRMHVHLTSYGHGGINRCAGLGFTDVQYARHIRDLHGRGLLENTALILLSDHGHYQHANIPYLSITLGDDVLQRHPSIGRHLEANQKKIVTAFDLYTTMTHLLSFPKPYNHGTSYDKQPGTSLFGPIPDTRRSCIDAGIPLQYCAVGREPRVKLDPNGKDVMALAFKCEKHLNDITQPFRRKCRQLHFDTVAEASVFLGWHTIQLFFFAERRAIGEQRTRLKYLATLNPQGKIVVIEQVTTWQSNKPCIPPGVRMEYCQCMPLQT